MHRILIPALTLVTSLAAYGAESSRPASAPASHKKLIEFGWDEPDTAFMRAHAAELDASPFDGCVFHVTYTRDGQERNFSWDAWGKQVFTKADLRQALVELRLAPLRRCRENFLRINTTPADLDWFDDHAAVLANMELAARFARQAGCPGILFDIEQYKAPLFEYSKQRDAATQSWDQYAAQVRLRGREVMAAFQAGYPDLQVFLTFGYCLPWAQTHDGKQPLAEAKYGLLAPFMDGLVDGVKGKTQLIDGVERAYSYMQVEDFARGRKEVLEGVLPVVADPRRYAKCISVSFGLWMDFDWRKKGWNAEDATQNPHTPESFGRLVRAALQNADEYVWIYTETPRWWSPGGGPVKLPAAYGEAIRAAHHRE